VKQHPKISKLLAELPTIGPGKVEQRFTAKEVLYGKAKDRYLAPFSKRHKIRHQFYNLPVEQQIVLLHCLSTKDGKYAYIKNSKAGCTTIGNLLYLYEFDEEFSGNIHSGTDELRQGYAHWESNLSALSNPKTVSFTFVRNPEKRAVSAFVDFFVDQVNPNMAYHSKAIESFGFSKQDDYNYKFDVFLEYIEACLNDNAVLTDRHWRPQHINIGSNLFDLFFVGKLETIEQDIAKLNALSDGNLPRPSSLKASIRNKSSEIQFTPSADQKCRIRSIYKKDFELFSY